MRAPRSADIGAQAKVSPMDESDSIAVPRGPSAPGSMSLTGLVESLVEMTGPDPKNRHLVFIAVKSALRDKVAVRNHVPLAKQLGATRAELEQTICLALSACRLARGASCLQLALDVYDASENPPLDG